MNDSTSNPFSPPQAPVADLVQLRALPPARKPIAVWLMQGFGALSMLWVGIKVLPSGLDISRLGGVAGMAGLLASSVLYLAYFVVLVLDCQKRQRRGRRMGLTLMSLLLLLELLWLAVALLSPVASAPAVVTPSVLTAATLAWGWRFGFSRAARAWFGLDVP